jgi:hypothetical protein
METMTERMTFQEFRNFMWETPKGQVVDSLIAVEVGLLDYETWWTAHLDVLEHLGETHEDHDIIFEFLIGIAEQINLGEISDDIDKVLGAHA